MLTPRTEDTIHKAWLLRLLIAIADDALLTEHLYFKGGTCAALLGYLNRFSLDLDFDYTGTASEIIPVKKQIETHAKELGLTIKDRSEKGIQYFFRYDAPVNTRNTIKVEAQFPPPKANEYAALYLSEIDRTMRCQTIQTMFANKLVALIDRYEKTGGVAGRDVYDIHQFFLQGLKYVPAVIEERRGTSVGKFFEELVAFVEKKITGTALDQDLNSLVPYDSFKKNRKALKVETLSFLRDELARLKK